MNDVGLHIADVGHFCSQHLDLILFRIIGHGLYVKGAGSPGILDFVGQFVQFLSGVRKTCRIIDGKQLAELVSGIGGVVGKSKIHDVAGEFPQIIFGCPVAGDHYF